MLTLSTVDGAKIEIPEAAGVATLFLFGLDAGEVTANRAAADPSASLQQNAGLQWGARFLESGRFNRFEPGLRDPIVQFMRDTHDP